MALPEEIEPISEPSNIEDNVIVSEAITDGDAVEELVEEEILVNEEQETVDVEEIQEIEEIHPLPMFEEDFSAYSKKEYVDLADKMLDTMSSRGLTSSDVKNIDAVLKNVRASFEDLNAKEKSEAKKEYISKNGSDDGFEFKNDNFTVRFEGILIQIREKKHAFYQKIEREREDYFETKTRLLQSLRELVEAEEKGESKNGWDKFKQLQLDWKNAGNVSSPHNGTFWSTYNALVDRYFDLRSIQNELKDLDRKKNILNKEGVVIKIEALAEGLKETPLTNVVLRRANELLNEYKQIGPGPREEQEVLWSRLKSAFDVIYEKKREFANQNSALQEDIYNAKLSIFESFKKYVDFQSESINEWNTASKEVMEIQNKWNAIKGPTSKEKGKEISKEFWASLKLFFKHKSDFFHK
ncbi:MAG: DUF349 domain-containing protein, partial [Leadbetterella sp.]